MYKAVWFDWVYMKHIFIYFDTTLNSIDPIVHTAKSLISYWFIPSNVGSITGVQLLDFCCSSVSELVCC